MAHPILTTVVGSYPVPQWLHGNPSRLALRDAIMAVLKTQELAGLDVIADGELNRFDPNHPETNGMIDYFIKRMTGVKSEYTLTDILKFREDHGVDYRKEPAAIVTGKIEEGTLNLPGDFDFIKPLTKSKLKFTCTGPHMLAKVITNNHYKDTASLAMDIAEVLRKQLQNVDADIIQLDEANISGHPEDAGWAAEALNHVLDGIKGERGLHICFGNYGGQTIQKGFWKDLAPFLNKLHVNHLILEFARRGYAELDDIKHIDDQIGLGIGVVDIKDNEVESPDLIAKRIDTIVNSCGEGRLHYIHPDCGFWMLQRNVADRKMETLVKGRDLYLGK
jgi:5-methyltetrahydropteroyltriglutamate--homocysteine methyltransferase